jgi:catechol 2,3-dioxygenase-like lactoylglutathione lyase family enzyme
MAGDQNPQQRVMPTLRMTDYASSKRFYVEGLGFHVDWEHRFEPGFPVFAQVSRDGLAFFLTEHTGDCPVGGLVHLYVPDVDSWFEEFRQRGLYRRAPERMPPAPAQHDRRRSRWKQAAHLHPTA